MSNGEEIQEGQTQTTVVTKEKDSHKDDRFEDDSLHNWLLVNDLNKFEIRVYKLSGGRRNFMKKYDSEIPSEEEIGLSFGSGSYLFAITAETQRGGRKSTSRRIHLGNHFDDLKIKHDREKALSLLPPQAAQSVQSLNLSDIANGIAVITAAVSPLIAALAPLFKPKDDTTMHKMMLSNFNAMNNVMKSNMLENVDIYKDMQRKLMEVEEMDNQQQPSLALALFEQFAPMLNNFIPKILGGGVQGEAIKGIIKGAAEFKELQTNPAEAAALVELIAKEQGEEKAIKLAEALDLNILEEN
jgi:hypothetical protein